MITRSRLLSRPSLLGMALSACLAAPLAMAAGSGASPDMQARYKADVERCNTGQTNQDKATCLQEAGAALEEARRHRLTNEQRLSSENHVKRCEALPGTQRDDCMLQMSGQNTTVHGSVAGGGVLRETIITVPADTMTGSTTHSTTPGLVPNPTMPAPSLAPVPSTTTPAQPYTPGQLAPAAGTQ